MIQEMGCVQGSVQGEKGGLRHVYQEESMKSVNSMLLLLRYVPMAPAVAAVATARPGNNKASQPKPRPGQQIAQGCALASIPSGVPGPAH